MPFCPKCRTEYREGFVKCADCKVALVDKLDDIEIQEASLDEIFEKEVEQQAQSIDISDIFDEKSLEALNITKEKLEEWKTNPPTPEEIKQMKRFILKQRMIEEENEKFVSKKEKASEYLSSGICLVIVGVLGITFVVLAFLKVLPFIHLSGFGYVIYAIVGIIMAFMLYFGISSLLKVKSTKIQAESEEDELNTVNAFFDKEISAQSIDSDLDITDDENLNYFLRSEKIKTILKNQFPDLKEGYIDSLIDERYSDIFD